MQGNEIVMTKKTVRTLKDEDVDSSQAPLLTSSSSNKPTLLIASTAMLRLIARAFKNNFSYHCSKQK